ncbi:MAG: thermonuclease family protein [Dehalococcoidia bacterium]
MTLLLGAAILLSVFVFNRSGSDGDEPATAGVPALELREGRWYASPAFVLTAVGVEHVIDGDTLNVLALSTLLRVRAFGFDAPEPGERCSSEATARLTALTAGGVQLLADERLQDRFSRELRYLFTPDRLSIDAVMIGEGLARAWTEDGALRDALVAIEDEARSEHRGCLWVEG